MKQSPTQKRIKHILYQHNYRVKNGEVYRQNIVGEWICVYPSHGQILLVPLGDTPELFLWSDVEEVIEGMDGGGNGVIKEKTKVKKS